MQHMLNNLNGRSISHFNLIIILSIIISGCINRQIDFQTLDQGQISNYHEKEANFFIITDNGTWENFYYTYFKGKEPYVNFDDYVVVAVFQGEKNTGGYNISIEKISQIGNILNILVIYTMPKKGQIVIQAITQPYHIIKLKKDNIKKGTIFIFKDDKGEEIKRITYG